MHYHWYKIVEAPSATISVIPKYILLLAFVTAWVENCYNDVYIGARIVEVVSSKFC